MIKLKDILLETKSVDINDFREKIKDYLKIDGEWKTKGLQKIIDFDIKTAKEQKQLRPELQRYEDDEKVILLANICYEIQEQRGDGQFYMSGYKAGKIIGQSQPAAREKLNTFVFDGVLRLLKKGVPGENGISSLYKYICQDVGE